MVIQWTLHRVGAKCVFASEWDKNARASYEANYSLLEPELFNESSTKSRT